ncbi:MAG: translation elongation factor Ts [Acidimicrobiia bacterium]|nr:translation elongation factor Ts [Acidimicrobiia bacterium]
MAAFTAKDVQELRRATGAGMMDAKKALVDSDGDHDAAAQLLREKGLAKAASRQDRDSNDGAVAIAVSDSAAALVELSCETDFSAKADDFVGLANELAELVLADGPDAVATKADAIDDLKISKKENIELGTVVRVVAADGQTIDSYLHTQDGRGVNGVVVVASGVDAETLHAIALHIAFAKPTVLHRDQVDPDAVARERAALLDITKAEGKPEKAWEKIVEGRLGAWFKETVLLEQGLHGDKASVQDTIGDGEIISFTQAYIGS